MSMTLEAVSNDTRARPVQVIGPLGEPLTLDSLTPPSTSYKSFSVMGKTFDPTKPDDYLAGFKIRKAS